MPATPFPAVCFPNMKHSYDLYVSMVCNGIDPQQEKEKLARMKRLVNGTDETSITYL